MAEPWAQSYENLLPTSRAIVLGLVVLGLGRVPADDLPAVACTDDEHVLAPAVGELAGSGWLVPGDDGEWRLGRSPADLARSAVPPVAAALVARIAGNLLRVLGTRRIGGAVVVAAVRAAARHRLFDVAVSLASTAWRVGVSGDGRVWWRELAEAGEDAAIGARRPAELIGLLESSAVAFAGVAEIHVADRQWRRALVLAEQFGDRERSAVLLGRLGELRRRAGSFGRALTAFHELVAVRQQLRDRPGLADALTEVATTMMCADRDTDARYFLGRAEKALPDLVEVATTDRTRHAETLIRLGRCWDRQHAPGAAMSCYSKALAAVVDVDEAAAEVARTSLAAAARRRADRSRRVTRGTG